VAAMVEKGWILGYITSV